MRPVPSHEADPSDAPSGDNASATIGDHLVLSKPLGTGIVATAAKRGDLGRAETEAMYASMCKLNAGASRAALAVGVRCATDVTGFGLLGHLYKLVRASGVSAVIDASAVPYLEAARPSLAEGFVPGGSRRNLDWVRPHLDAAVEEDELLLLADAQTSGGLLVAGELPGHPVVGELVPRRESAVCVRG